MLAPRLSPPSPTQALNPPPHLGTLAGLGQVKGIPRFCVVCKVAAAIYTAVDCSVCLPLCRYRIRELQMDPGT